METLLIDTPAEAEGERETDNDGWRLMDYRLAVFPEGEGGERVRRLAEGTSDTGSGADSPSIRIARFKAREAMEETLIRWIRRVCRLQSRFPVALTGTPRQGGAEPHLQVTDPEPFRRLIERLRAIEMILPNEDGKTVEWAQDFPCRIPGEAKGMATLAGFHAEFTAHSLVMLKHAPEDDRDELVNVFPLNP